MVRVERIAKNLIIPIYSVSFSEVWHADFEHRLEYCFWCNDNLNDDTLLGRTFFTGGAWFVSAVM